MSKLYLEPEECSICLEPLDNRFQKYILECGHQFHTTCLKDWYKNCDSGYRCPLCNEIKEIINVTENINEICSFVAKDSSYKKNKSNTLDYTSPENNRSNLINQIPVNNRILNNNINYRTANSRNITNRSNKPNCVIL
uniref:RING-type domain-containing protein n=1 Tax=viral metagenome TaxID=1070528 RepID=A0A6C0IVR3_9ZZZZ